MHVSTGGNDITVTINDYINKESTSYQITDINNNIKINDIINKIKKLKNYNYSNSSLVLYFAKVECKLDEKLSTYNKSNRKTIKLELYISSLITINVRTLQSCGSGTTRCIPLWSFCCRQSIKIRIVDTSDVRSLKQRIYSATDDDISIPVDNIVLLYKGAPLNNFLTLKESELVDNCSVDYFVPICYIYKEKKKETPEEDNDDETELGIYKDKKSMKKIESTKIEEKNTKVEEIKKAPTSTEIRKASTSTEIKKAPTSTEIKKASTSIEIKKNPTATEIKKASTSTEIKKTPTTEVKKASPAEEIKKERLPSNNTNTDRSRNKNRRGRKQP
ncbi:conserved protein, unknown function [Plasmodium yoelii]|uniref:Ubiquitin-like protein n=3 Tax=Plasmodium yoelii TaxID=5861 RepID=A0AAE9WM75_PLAYO|nr:conserved protein, unknown function [Plasmodium yoelii]EAA22604.1 hypothetical protein [Plasmodium yoelii yoelii]WBY56335.1 ubiquitin-like protein [Plasmodium yoelii yoelii]CDU17234.1 conserved Plasmodium protein, unknown function [Plasmodium yoelii]VTZ76407.1 conserved protein, unknown function [Plasmodium yoelii]|eukprot:XP_731039.1 conserved protein, unknown function [Plasmodium yoelii]